MRKRRKKTSNKYKIRSGKRILGIVTRFGNTYGWEAVSKFSTKDRGVSSTPKQAIRNVLKANAGTGTVEGFKRAYEVTVERQK